jgi:hypothetical protein
MNCRRETWHPIADLRLHKTELGNEGGVMENEIITSPYPTFSTESFNLESKILSDYLHPIHGTRSGPKCLTGGWADHKIIEKSSRCQQQLRDPYK